MTDHMYMKHRFISFKDLAHVMNILPNDIIFEIVKQIFLMYMNLQRSNKNDYPNTSCTHVYMNKIGTYI